jgi:hypothetical protein
MDKRAKISWLGHLERMGKDRVPKKIFTQELEGTRWKEEVERDLKSAGSEKMERVGDRWGKMEGYFSTGQSPQWAVVPIEEEEEAFDAVKVS